MVQFITESRLREMFKEHPVKEYEIKEEEKLTPGGRQYLLDKGIKISSFKEEKKEKDIDIEKDSIKSNKKDKLYYELKGMEIAILKEGSNLSKKNIIQVRELIELSKDIGKISSYIKDSKKELKINYSICTGFDSSNIKEDLEVCMDITDIIMNLKEKEILLCLYTNLYKLKEIQYEFEELNKEENTKVIYENISIITNKINQMICKTIGGVECQRTINVSNIAID